MYIRCLGVTLRSVLNSPATIFATNGKVTAASVRTEEVVNPDEGTWIFDHTAKTAVNCLCGNRFGQKVCHAVVARNADRAEFSSCCHNDNRDVRIDAHGMETNVPSEFTTIEIRCPIANNELGLVHG